MTLLVSAAMNTVGCCLIPNFNDILLTLATAPDFTLGISVLATIILVCVLKLHKTLVYRLALYQVLSAMECCVLWKAVRAYEFKAGKSYISLNGAVYEGKAADVCKALLLGSAFVKLMLTACISIHLFALAVFHKNLQKLESLYVVSSLLVLLVVTATTMLPKHRKKRRGINS